MPQLPDHAANPQFPKARYFFLLDIFAVLFGTSFLLGLALGILNLTLNEESPYFLYGFYCLLMGLWTWTTATRFKQHNINLNHLIGNLQLKKLPWLVILIVFAAESNLSIGITNVNLFFTHLFNPNAADLVTDSLDIPLLYDWSLALSFLAIVIVAPITEEFIFRGALLHRWATKWSVMTGIVASSVLFGLVHFDFFIPERIVSGIIYSLMYFKTQTLLVPIILHFGTNFLAFFGNIVNDVAASSSDEPITIAYLWYGSMRILFSLPALIYFLQLPNDVRLLPYMTNRHPHQSENAAIEQS